VAIYPAGPKLAFPPYEIRVIDLVRENLIESPIHYRDARVHTEKNFHHEGREEYEVRNIYRRSFNVLNDWNIWNEWNSRSGLGS
jgi:hypothetical protein